MFRVYDITTILDQDCAAHNRNGFTYCQFLYVVGWGKKTKDDGAVHLVRGTAGGQMQMIAESK